MRDNNNTIIINKNNVVECILYNQTINENNTNKYLLAFYITLKPYEIYQTSLGKSTFLIVVIY